MLLDEKKWYRVCEPLNPLNGCDVKIRDDGTGLVCLCALRRVDVFVGDRPYQLRGDLGIWIREEHLKESPIQDDIMEMATDNPYGPFVGESRSYDNPLEMHIARYQSAIVVSLRDLEGPDDARLICSRTMIGAPAELDAKVKELKAAFDEHTNDKLIWTIEGMR